MAKPDKNIFERLRNLNDKIWKTSRKETSRWKFFLFKQLRIILLAARGFSNDKVQLRASALTFYSLLSLVPVMAIAFAIAKGFGLDKNLEEMINNSNLQDMVKDWLLTNSRNALQGTRGGYIAGVGVIILLWSVMSLLDNIESSFNHIFQVRIPRAWYRKFTDYFTILLISPIFIILSGSITLFISTQLDDFMSRARILEYFKPLISFLIQFAPYFLGWITMTILFIIMPNTKVKFLPALIAGIITGTILHVLQWMFIDLQSGIYRLNAIYGSFAVVPLFIVFLQSTWIVVLLGAELTYANQNISRYELEFESLTISYAQKKALVLMMMQRIVHNFATGEKPVSAEQLASELGIPVRLSREILQDLDIIDLVSLIHDKDNDTEQLYQPAMDINKLTINYVFSRMDNKGSGQITVANNKDYDKVSGILGNFNTLIENSDENVLIKDL